MADTVRYLMEAMIPELEDFQKRGYFSKEELKEVVRKREKFEYALKRRASRKEDYLGYVEYEQKLEELRVLRKQKLKIKGKKTVADHAIVKRIHFIFQRATRKFKPDLRLWLQWLDFCKQTDSGKLFSKVATSALKLHPHCAALWSHAAAWEFEHNGNTSAARLLMQQGLRMCKHEPALWVEYFNMELMYVRKLRARRKVLGLDVPGKKASPVSEQELREAGSTGPDIPLQEEAILATVPAAAAADDSEALAAVEAVLKGAVAMVVLRNAMLAIPDDLDMHQRLLEVAADFKFPGMKNIRQAIYKSIEAHFGNVEEAWDVLAHRHSHNEASISLSALEACCSVYEQAMQHLPTSKMCQLYASFLHRVLSAKMADPEQIESAAAVAQKLLSVFKQAHQAGTATADLYLQWHQVAEQLQQPKVSLTALRYGCCTHPSSTALWTSRLQREAAVAGLRAAKQGALFEEVANGKSPLHAYANGDGKVRGNAGQQVGIMQAPGVAEGLQAAVREALRCVPAHKGAGVWKQALQLMGSSQDNMEQLQELLLHNLMSCSKGPLRGGLGEVAGVFLTTIAQQSGLDSAREFFRKLSQVPCAGGDMFHAMLALEEAALSDTKACGKRADPTPLKHTFEAAVTAYGQQDTELWLKYASWCMTVGASVGDVYWRATKALEEPREFVESYRQLQQL